MRPTSTAKRERYVAGAHAILLNNKSYTINQILDIIEIKRDMASTWLSQCEEDGIEGLQDKSRKGRSNLLSENDLAVLQQLAEEHSHQLPVLYAKFQDKTGKVVSQYTLLLAVIVTSLCMESDSKALRSHRLLTQPKAERTGVPQPSGEADLPHRHQAIDH